jgi:hypothetical protein
MWSAFCDERKSLSFKMAADPRYTALAQIAQKTHILQMLCCSVTQQLQRAEYKTPPTIPLLLRRGGNQLPRDVYSAVP